MKTSKKTRAEIQRAYRQRLREKDAEAMREKERKRWHVRCSLLKIKPITDMTEREKRTTRKMWRTKKADYRAKVKKKSEETPPPSDDGCYMEYRKRGRAKVAYRRTKAYRKIASLTSTVDALRTTTERYKKRWMRLKMFVADSHSRRMSTLPSSSSSTSGNVIRPESSMGVSLESSILSTESNTQDGDTRSKHGNAIDDETVSMIKAFFTRDDNSRITTGKKQTVTKNKVKEQKRLLLDTISNLHEKFCAENPANNISYVSFCRYRPFWVRQPNMKDRDTCLCKRHENLQLAVDKLYHLGALKVKHVEELLLQVCCNVNTRECMYRECEICVNKRIAFEDISVLKDDSTIIWSEWETQSQTYEKEGHEKSSKVTRKTVKRGPLKQLKAKLCEGVRGELAMHVYNVRHQFRAYKHLKETVDVNEAILHIDFSENYACKNATEIQAAHFGASNRQATLHTGVAYTVDEQQSFTTISDSLRHDPAAIWAHLKPVLQDLRNQHPEITDVHFFSDGPTTQYRNKVNFYLFSTMLKTMGFESGSWNFFESGHGKGAADAVGGSVKRQADAMVLRGIDIPDAKKLFNFLDCGNSAVKFYFIETSAINEVEATYPKTLKPIHGTMKLHQLLTDEELNVVHRDLSCFCQRPTVCTCYNLRRSQFPPMKNHVR